MWARSQRLGIEFKHHENIDDDRTGCSGRVIRSRG